MYIVIFLRFYLVLMFIHPIFAKYFLINRNLSVYSAE